MWKLIILIGLSQCYSLSIPRQSTKKPVEFDEVIPNSFGASGFGGTWISANEYTFTQNGNFMKYNVETETTSIILSSDYISQQSWSGPSYRISPDGTKILVRYAARAIFRHSTVARFSIIDAQSPGEEIKVANGEEIQTAFFAPNSAGLGYIRDNNIYYLDLISIGLPLVITADGVTGVIYNGIPDWVYEEEVLGSDAAVWVSPSGKYLSYIRFDDRNVSEATYELYGDGAEQYPEEVYLRYPKAGTTNPTVSLHVVDLEDPNNLEKHIELAAPIDKITEDHILGIVFWITDDALGAIWLNRRQNRGVFVSYDTATFAMNEVMEINEPSGWIDLNSPKCDANAKCYFINNADNWPRVVSVDTISKETIIHSAVGMNVLSIYGIQNGIIYYLSTPSALESFNRHVYAGNTCLTCSILTPEGKNCSYASASFSKDFSFYSMVCSGPDPTFVKIYKTDGSKEPLNYQDNSALRARIQEYDLPVTRFIRVPVDGGFQAVVRLQVPSHIDIDENSDKVKYPMLIRVYGGPGSIRVLSSWSIGYQTYQTSKKNIIYVEIDGRGTAQNGVDFMFAVNNRLGTYEMEDQIAVSKYLVDHYKFIDGSRVAIWGWSYGGYATAMSLAIDTKKVMKCGISVAPVTSWRFYDTIYTERYMGINSSAENYITSDVSLASHVKVIGEHEFFLIHGNADDNVHYQQSMVLARALELQDILFDQLSYPDENHSIASTRNISRHLYHAMDNFWDRCFNLE